MKIRIHDTDFEPFISDEEVRKRVQDLALEITSAESENDPIFIPILNGSFVFAAELALYLDLDAEFEFLKVSSYNGTESTEQHKELIGLNADIKGRNVIVIEDIVDTGLTIKHIYDVLEKMQPKSLKTIALLHKPDAAKVPLNIDYTGFTIANKFVVGYGLDYNQRGRGLRGVWVKAD